VCVGRRRGGLGGGSLLQDWLYSEGGEEAAQERPVGGHAGFGGVVGKERCGRREIDAGWRLALAHPAAPTLIAEDWVGECDARRRAWATGASALACVCVCVERRAAASVACAGCAPGGMVGYEGPVACGW